MQRSISNYINTYGTIVLLFWINVRNTVNEAIAWWQSNTKQHSHLIDGLLLLSIVCHFLSLTLLIKVYHHHFLQHLKWHTFFHVIVLKECIALIEKLLPLPPLFQGEYFVTNFSVDRGYRKGIKKWYTINVKFLLLAKNDK